MGYLIVEIEDIFNHFKTKIDPLPKSWLFNFKVGTVQENFNMEELITKNELIQKFELRYDLLMKIYSELSNEQKNAKHPSKMLSEFYTNIDAWIVHHLITHLAIHTGNITIWKKVNNIMLNGF